MNLAEAAVFLGKVGPAREQGREAQFLAILDIPFFLSPSYPLPLSPLSSLTFFLPPSLPLFSFYCTQLFQQRSSIENFRT